MTAAARPLQLDYGFLLRGAWFGLIAVVSLYWIKWSAWDSDWAALDLARYISGTYGSGYLYSPAFAALVSPLRLLPFDLVVALWRIGEVVALALAVRGTFWGWGVFLLPGLWQGELVGCNVMGYATAGMIAVIRWPSVRSVSLYAVLVALIPKPAFLPVMAWGFLVVPAARAYVLAIGAAGLAMLAWPGYLGAILRDHESEFAAFNWPQPWGYLSAAAVTVAGFRWPRLLGVAALLATPYVYAYHSIVLGASLVRARR